MTSALEWSVASRPFPGEIESGDRYEALERDEGLVLAVIDGLGHGPSAAAAAASAAAAVRVHASEALPVIVRACGAALAGERGAVLTIARIDPTGTLTWLGVGNATGHVWRRSSLGFEIVSVAPLARGVIGSSLPDLQEKRVELVAGDVIVLTSDGIAQPERWSPRFLGAPRYAAEAWLAERARDDDDALALVARYGAV